MSCLFSMSKGYYNLHSIIFLSLLQIFVVGPAGCGKSECIKTFAVAERERGKTISVQTVFAKAVESEELMGYFDQKTK